MDRQSIPEARVTQEKIDQAAKELVSRLERISSSSFMIAYHALRTASARRPPT